MEKIYELLESFQDGYTKRRMEDLDAFVDKHFDSDANIQVLGTSDGEVYVGYDEVKSIIGSDWSDWGDFQLDFESMISRETRAFTCISMEFSMKYTFEDTPSVYSNFMELVKENSDEKYLEDAATLKFKQNESLWLLDHVLHKRPDRKRGNFWTGLINFVLKKDGQTYKISQLSYSFPVKSLLPDERFHPLEYYEASFNRDLEKINSHTDKSIEHLDVFGLEFDEDFYFVDVDGEIYQGLEGQEMMVNRIEDYDLFTYDYNKGLFQESHRELAFIHLGIGEKTLTEEVLRKELNDLIHTWIHKDENDIYKLFKIRQALSFYNKEIAMGQDFKWPLRIHGILNKEKNQKKLMMLALSYPTNTILEDKY